ncbi:MAG: sigma-70 family RNA polymerase sigma factor [Chloroflexi bacterium]|nr:sigma-70 family RNA polymerase sigma factor [Chloroflexota bacterium]
MTDPKYNEDIQLILDIGGGDERALEAVYDRYAHRVYSLAMSVLRDEGLAEDAVQEVFSNIWQKAQSYRPEMSAPGTWIMSVAHHKIVDFYRSRRRTTDHTAQPEMETLMRVPDQKLSVEQQVERSFNARLVRAALLELPEEQSQPLYLSAWHGYSQSEIAQMLNIPLGTVKTRMRLGMQKLKAALEEYVA